jgi:hypothetical protein
MDAKFVSEWIKGKTAADFDLIEYGGRMLWPDKLHRLKPGGKFEEIPICVQVPRFDEELVAMAQAEAMLTEKGLDRKDHESTFETLEQLAKVAVAIREPKPPHAQFQTLDVLISSKDTGIETRELFAVWQRIELYQKLHDARLSDIDEPTAIALAHAINEVRNISPLVAIVGLDVDSCVVSMAATLVRCLTDRSYSPSLASSTPARSRKRS